MGKISEIFNFDNIGGKIKNLTKWSCWITILIIWIVAPITYIVLVADDWAELCWIPVVSAIVGPIFVWIGSWAMYAFGEFVEDTHAMRNKYYPMAEEQANREAEERANREAEERAKREAEAKAKHEAELKAQQEAAARAKCKAEETAKRQQDNEFQEGELSDDDFIDIACPKCGEMLSFLKNEVKGICPECGAEFEIK